MPDNIKLVEIKSSIPNLDHVLAKFVDINYICPILANQIVEKVHGLTAFSTDNPCLPLLENVIEFEKKYDVHLNHVEIKDASCQLNEINDFVKDVNSKMSEQLERTRSLQSVKDKYTDALTQIQNIETLDVSLDDLFACDYIYIRFGKLPSDSVDKLRFFQNKPFVFQPLREEKNTMWCMYFTTLEYKREIDNIFSSLLFERSFIPNYIKGTPKEAKEQLLAEIAFTDSEINHSKAVMTELTKTYETEINKTEGELMFYKRIFDAKKYVIGLGNKFSISGFIETKMIDSLKQDFQSLDDVELEIKDATLDGRIKPPSRRKLSKCLLNRR